MSDLVICINFIESKKKKALVFETYLGKIPKLKSKQFSGPLRKVDINTIDRVDNLNENELLFLKKFLYMQGNVQINKYQFTVANKNVINIQDKIGLNCVFYREKNTPMYLVENAIIEMASGAINDTKEIRGVEYRCAKNKIELFVCIKECFCEDQEQVIQPNFYIDIETSDYKAKLYFRYGNREFDYFEKINQRFEEKSFRNYHIEKTIVCEVEKSGWYYKNTGEFEYVGKSIHDSIVQLLSKGIAIYTNKKKKISAGNIKNVSISYNMDWFSLKGEIEVGENGFSLDNLFDFRKRINKWIEVEDTVVFVPETIEKYSEIISKSEQELIIEKKHLGQVLCIADDLGVTWINNLNAITDYNKIIPRINSEIYAKLRDYQKTGVKWLLYLFENKFGGCLADDMGLGKTFQAIAYLSDERFRGTRNLIVVPKTLLINWKRELDKFGDGLRLYVYHGNERDFNKAKECEIILTTYGMTINDYEELSSVVYSNVIVDEAQNIKNSSTKAYTAIYRIDAHSKILLTGTPMENNIQELYALMRLSNPDVFTSFKNLNKNIQNEEVLIKHIKRMISPFVLRRMKEEVLEDLPGKQEQLIYCKMDSLQEELYNNVLQSIQYEIRRRPDRFEIKSNSIILNGLLYLQQICCDPKLLSHDLNLNHCFDSVKTDVLIDMITQLNANGHKVVVFSRFTKMLKIIEQRLMNDNLLYYYLDGKTKNRMEVVDQFEKNEKGVFLVSLKAGGTGLNLTSADTAIIYDPWWNPAVEKQAEDRIYRIGQKKNVMVYRLIVANTIEEKIEELKVKKRNIASSILECEDDVTGITMEVLKELILDGDEGNV